MNIHRKQYIFETITKIIKESPLQTERPNSLSNARFQVKNGEIVDTDQGSMSGNAGSTESKPKGANFAQRLVFDKGTRDAFDAQMNSVRDNNQRLLSRRNAALDDAARREAVRRNTVPTNKSETDIQARIQQRRKLGMSELNPYSPEAVGNTQRIPGRYYRDTGTIEFDKDTFRKDPAYRQETIRQLNDTRSQDQRRQDREKEQTLDAVRQGGAAKQSAIDRFNASLKTMQSKSDEIEERKIKMGLAGEASPLRSDESSRLNQIRQDRASRGMSQ